MQTMHAGRIWAMVESGKLIQMLTMHACRIWDMVEIGKMSQLGAMHAGRIRDLVESGKLSLSAVKYFVLDEADRLLDTGNQDLILNLFSRFPKAGTGAARLQVYTSYLGTCDLTVAKPGIPLPSLTDQPSPVPPRVTDMLHQPCRCAPTADCG